jgi:hypothetical protein
MDKDVLDERLEQLFRKAMSEARAAVEAAPDGQWISASEWAVRQIMQRLTQESYEAMLQARADGHPAADQAAFSPDSGDDSAKPGRASLPGAHRRRRD